MASKLAKRAKLERQNGESGVDEGWGLGRSSWQRGWQSHSAMCHAECVKSDSHC